MWQLSCDRPPIAHRVRLPHPLICRSEHRQRINALSPCLAIRRSKLSSFFIHSPFFLWAYLNFPVTNHQCYC